MGMENMEPLLQNTPEHMGVHLREKIYDLQLTYVDKILKGQIPPPEALKMHDEKPKLGQLLASYTNLNRELASKYFERTGKEADPVSQEYVDFKDAVYTNIRDSYDFDTSDWIGKVKNIISEQILQLPKSAESSSSRPERPETGLLVHYTETLADLKKHDENSFLARELSTHGLNPEDEYISLHLEPVAKQKSQDPEGVENLFSKNSLAKIAVDIVENDPATRAVVGESWLLDTPVGQRVGFHLSERMPLNGSLGTWYQFLDKEGNLKEDEVQTFFETGKPRFYERQGYLLTEEFLKKYLPKEKRGIVTLKKVNPDFAPMLEIEKLRIDAIVSVWDDVNIESIKAMVAETSILSRFFTETEVGKKTWAFFLDEKEKGVPYAQMLTASETDGYSREYKRFVESLSYLPYTLEL